MPNKEIIYLDNAATTSVNPDVLLSYETVIKKYQGNASSIHALGMEAKDLLEQARNQILSLLNKKEDELIFTSGATEANNLALKGYALQYQNRGKHIIVSSIEHPSILETAKQLEEYFGFEVTYLPVNTEGKVEVETLKNSLRKDTILVSVMAVNNETGVIQPIEEIGELLKDYPKVAFHSDAAQAIGKVDIDYSNVDMITLTAHKIHGLKGCGCLIKRKAITFLPLISGGGQENNLRSGTNDIASAVAFSKALRLAISNQKKNQMYVNSLVEPLRKYFLDNPDLYEINSIDNPYILNVSLKTKKAAVVVEGLSERGMMISSVSACHSKGESASYVIKAMGKSDSLSHNTLRISFSEENTQQNVEKLIQNLDEIVKGLHQ